MELYPYQKQVRDILYSNRSVILQAPTGTGKTIAAVSPFLEAWEKDGQSFPKKCIYVVPMKVLANQFIDTIRKFVAENYSYTKSPNITIQTGDQSVDKRFEGDLIFCTVDQFLSSYLTMPYSLSKRMANFNAGALVGAYLVFDEFHLLDPGSTLPSVLYALKRLSSISPVLLMTATFSSSMLKELASIINAEVVKILPEEVNKIDTKSGLLNPRRRIWSVAEDTMSARAIFDLHKSRSLVICNTVKRAQLLYRNLCLLINNSQQKTTVILLHSRFLPEDRRNIEKNLLNFFGKYASPGQNVIAIATQTIEVGVDITCEILHSELAPASALIQRAGRCARYPGEEGQVIIYPVENYMPYGKGKNDTQNLSLWAKEMKEAYKWLKKHTGKIFTFETEQDFVNSVATPRDNCIIQDISAGQMIHTNEIHRVLRGELSANASRILVRDVDSKLVLIHPCPDMLLSDPYNATGFNLQTITLYGMVKDWLERKTDLEWRLKYLIEDKKPDSNEENRVDYGWEIVTDISQLATSRVIVVNPELAGYLIDEGFISDQGNTDFFSYISDKQSAQSWENSSYRLESYEEHIHWVLQAFQKISLPELIYPARTLEKFSGWPEGSIIHAAWLVCLFHDIGKLNIDWQNWAKIYQKKIGDPQSSGFAVGHTNTNPENPLHQKVNKEIQGKVKKPHHAGESALAVSKIIAQSLKISNQPIEPLVKAALTAITRHHTPFAQECDPYTLEVNSQKHIQTTLDEIPGEIKKSIDMNLLRSEVSYSPNSFSTILIGPEDTSGWMAYTLLARALRRADQEGTAQGNRKEA